MNQKAIGVFDSGLGGLTAVRELCRRLPHENIIFFGDTGRVPYGSRSREVIRKYAAQDMRFLQNNDVKMIIAACGTVSSAAADLGNALPLPFTGVVVPASHAAAKLSRSGRIGVIGTAATIASGAYRREISRINPAAQVFEQSCPLFVPLVEGGFVNRNDPVTRMVAERYLAPLREQRIDTLILGCTHYPIIAGIIRDVMGDTVKLIDTGAEAAREAERMLDGLGLKNASPEPGRCSFYVSDRVQGFAALGSLFLGRDIDGEILPVDVDTL
ncbi:MAG: glutamate racemase [Acutalibacteraceae bacterium]|jgi:glutamate racemase